MRTIIHSNMTEAEINSAADSAIAAIVGRVRDTVADQPSTVADRPVRDTEIDLSGLDTVVAITDTDQNVWADVTVSDYQRSLLWAESVKRNARQTARSSSVLASISVNLH